jgi:hypothetical protein
MLKGANCSSTSLIHARKHIVWKFNWNMQCLLPDIEHLKANNLWLPSYWSMYPAGERGERGSVGESYPRPITRMKRVWNQMPLSTVELALSDSWIESWTWVPVYLPSVSMARRAVIPHPGLMSSLSPPGWHHTGLWRMAASGCAKPCSTWRFTWALAEHHTGVGL